MKVIIAGSRTLYGIKNVQDAVEVSKFPISEVVSGHAPGIDTLGEVFARLNNLDLVIFPANWKRYGKSAGYRRNIKMAEYADALIAIWDGKSKGTKHMIDTATEKGLKVFVWKIPQNSTTKS